MFFFRNRLLCISLALTGVTNGNLWVSGSEYNITGNYDLRLVNLRVIYDHAGSTIAGDSFAALELSGKVLVFGISRVIYEFNGTSKIGLQKVRTRFDTPAKMDIDAGTQVVVANGITSNPVNVTVKPPCV